MKLKDVALTDNMFRFNDGVFVNLEKGFYFINCIHGDENGDMTLLWNDRIYSIYPSTLRKVIQRVANIVLSLPIVIDPCFPKMVKEKYAIELEENNIKVVGDWDTKTMCLTFETEDGYFEQLDFSTYEEAIDHIKKYYPEILRKYRIVG